jgi:hypothetical protein
MLNSQANANWAGVQPRSAVIDFNSSTSARFAFRLSLWKRPFRSSPVVRRELIEALDLPGQEPAREPRPS